jgi:formate/nitrite transporter FocA (FNT family)
MKQVIFLPNNEGKNFAAVNDDVSGALFKILGQDFLHVFRHGCFSTINICTALYILVDLSKMIAKLISLIIPCILFSSTEN